MNSTQSLEVLCDKFPELTLFHFDQGKETDKSHVVQFFPLAKLKRLQVLIFNCVPTPCLYWIPVSD